MKFTFLVIMDKFPLKILLFVNKNVDFMYFQQKIPKKSSASACRKTTVLGTGNGSENSGFVIFWLLRDFHEYEEETRQFERLIEQLPDRIWIE